MQNRAFRLKLPIPADVVRRILRYQPKQEKTAPVRVIEARTGAADDQSPEGDGHLDFTPSSRAGQKKG